MMQYSRSKVLKRILKINLGEFADKIGISPQYLSDILGGRKQPSYSLCLKMEEYSGISFLWFLLPPDKARFFTDSMLATDRASYLVSLK